MKKRRFEELHGKAIRWPEGKLEYIGIDGDQKHVMHEAKKGEVRYCTHSGQNDADGTYSTHSSLTLIFRIRRTRMGVTRHWSPNELHATRSSGSILTGLRPKS
jgi:hypothetical protein